MIRVVDGFSGGRAGILSLRKKARCCRQQSVGNRLTLVAEPLRGHTLVVGQGTSVFWCRTGSLGLLVWI